MTTPAPAATWRTARPLALAQSFEEGVLREGADDFPLTTTDLGELPLPTGRLAACDPYITGPEDKPVLDLALEPGSYRVSAVTATVGPGHERLAALILEVGTEPVLDWRMASWVGRSETDLGDDEYYGGPVDAGTWAYFDASVLEPLDAMMRDDDGMLEDPVSEAIESETPGRALVEFAPGHWAAVCSSGWGDGYYPVWIGLGADGTPVRLVTDFLLTGEV
jgi:hypothetical protein